MKATFKFFRHLVLIFVSSERPFTTKYRRALVLTLRSESRNLAVLMYTINLVFENKLRSVCKTKWP